MGHNRQELYCNVCCSLAARGYRYNPAFVLRVFVGDALFGPVPPSCLEELYRENTTLLPEQWMSRVSLEDIAQQVQTAVRPDPALFPAQPDNWEDLLNAALADPDEDRLAQATFPPRAPEDLGIRYVRAADVRSFYISEGRSDELRSVLRQLRLFDFIAMTNLCLAKIVFTVPF